VKDNPARVKAFKIYGFKPDDMIMNKNDSNNVYKIIQTATGREQLAVPQFGNDYKKIAVSCIYIDDSESELNFLK
jgi:hypothetical protein